MTYPQTIECENDSTVTARVLEWMSCSKPEVGVVKRQLEIAIQRPCSEDLIYLDEDEIAAVWTLFKSWLERPVEDQEAEHRASDERWKRIRDEGGAGDYEA